MITKILNECLERAEPNELLSHTAERNGTFGGARSSYRRLTGVQVIQVITWNPSKSSDETNKASVKRDCVETPVLSSRWITRLTGDFLF